jgi:hypothetical protein
MNRYVFNVANRVFEIHIQSPVVASLYETTCFEVLEGRLQRRLIPVVLKKGDVMQTEMGTELEVLLGARALLQRKFAHRQN